MSKKEEPRIQIWGRPIWRNGWHVTVKFDYDTMPRRITMASHVKTKEEMMEELEMMYRQFKPPSIAEKETFQKETENLKIK